MATGNTAARNARANDFATDFAAGTLQIRNNTTVLATHTLTGFGAATNGVITANAISDETIAATGTANNAKLIAGSSEYDLTLATSAADVVVSNTSYVSGETSSITGFQVTFPA